MNNSEHWVGIKAMLRDKKSITQADIDESNRLLAEARDNPGGPADRELCRWARREETARAVRRRLMLYNGRRVSEDDVLTLQREMSEMDPRIDRDEIDVLSLTLDELRARLEEQAQADARLTEFAGRLVEIHAKFDEHDAAIAKAVESVQKAAAVVLARIAERNKLLHETHRAMREEGIPLDYLGRGPVSADLVLDALRRRVQAPVMHPVDADVRTLPQKIRDAFKPLRAAPRPPAREEGIPPVFASDTDADSPLYRVSSTP